LLHGRGRLGQQILEKLVAKDTELSDMIAEIQTRQSLSREIQQTRDAIAGVCRPPLVSAPGAPDNGWRWRLRLRLRHPFCVWQQFHAACTPVCSRAARRRRFMAAPRRIGVFGNTEKDAVLETIETSLREVEASLVPCPRVCARLRPCHWRSDLMIPGTASNARCGGHCGCLVWYEGSRRAWA